MNELTICLEGPLKPHHVPILFAKNGGLFEGRNLEIDWCTPDSESLSLNCLLNGNSDIAVTRPLNLVSHFLKGDDIIGIGSFFHTNSGIMYCRNRGFEKISEIPDDSDIVCSDITTDEARLLFQHMVNQKNNETTDVKDINFHQPDNDPIETFFSGEYDVFITAGVNPEGVQMEQSDYEVDFWFYDEYDVPSNGDLVFVTSQNLANDEPKMVQDFIHSLHDSVKVLEENADRGRTLIKDDYPELLDIPGGQALLHTSLSELTSNFSQDFQTYTAWGDFLTEQGNYEGFIDVDRLIDERFIPLDSMTF